MRARWWGAISRIRRWSRSPAPWLSCSPCTRQLDPLPRAKKHAHNSSVASSAAAQQLQPGVPFTGWEKGVAMETHPNGRDSYRELIEIGIALSAEKDPARLRERILVEAKDFTNADAGTLYLKHKGKELRFQIVRNDSLGIAMGGTTGVECDLPPVPLITEDGKPNMRNVASYCAITGEIVNIAD